MWSSSTIMHVKYSLLLNITLKGHLFKRYKFRFPRNMKCDKTSDPDTFTSEMISAWEEWGVDQIMRLLNTIYNSGNKSVDLCKSMFTATRTMATDSGWWRFIAVNIHCSDGTWLIHSFSHWLTDWIIDWLMHRSIVWLNDWLNDQRID